MQRFDDQDVVRLLSGANPVRDGELVGLAIMAGDSEWAPQIQLKFNVPNGRARTSMF